VDLEFVANFPVNKDILDLNFEVQAGLNFGNIALLLKGGYGQDFYLETNVPHCTMDDIRELYTLTTGRELEPFHHSIKFDDITFRVDPNGLQFSGEVTVDGHRSVGATIAIKRDGIAITGSVLDIQLGAITVEKGQLDIFIGRPAGNETSRQSGFAITGNVSFHHLELEVAVYTTFTEGEGVQWTVYGEIEGTEMQLHRLAPDVKDSWLDLELTQVAFIASSCDSPKGCYNVFDYPIRKGVQFCATISSCLKPLDHVTNKQINGLVLRAAWSPDRGFSFGVVLPTPVGIHLTKSITSGPVEVEIIVSKMPQLQLTASVNYAAPRQSQPLVFTLGLKADLDSAEGFGQMTNYWYGPFGIEGVKIGPNVALEVGIIYAVLVATGTPSKLGFSAGLAIGDVEAQVRAVISEDPADELIYASLNQLSIQDLAKFASQISGEEIPLPPEDLLCFRNVLLYLSTGTSVGTTYYPAGASFRGQMDLFGQTTKHECTVGATTKIATEFEGLQLGPLTVGGAVGGKSCSAVVELGVDKQHILIDGAVILFDFEASIHGVFDILPTPNMEFELRLAYAEALEITLGAKIVGVPSFSNLSDADFEVYAILEQDIIGYLVRQIRYCIEALSKLLDGGIDAAYEFIDDAQDAIEDSIAAAVDTFEEARIAWEEKQIAVKNALQEVQDDLESSIKSLQDDLFGTRKEVEEAISNAQKELEQAKVQTVTAVSSAAHEVRRTKMEHEKGIASQLYTIREVKEKTKSAFGAVEMKVRETEEKVKRTQSEFPSRPSFSH